MSQKRLPWLAPDLQIGRIFAVKPTLAPLLTPGQMDSPPGWEVIVSGLTAGRSCGALNFRRFVVHLDHGDGLAAGLEHMELNVADGEFGVVLRNLPQVA